MLTRTARLKRLLVQSALLYNSFMSNAAKTLAAPSPREEMTALAAEQPLSTLCDSLLLLDALGAQGDMHRLARAITERCPAVRAALEAWAGDVKDSRTTTQVVIDAVKGE